MSSNEDALAHSVKETSARVEGAPKGGFFNLSQEERERRVQEWKDRLDRDFKRIWGSGS